MRYTTDNNKRKGDTKDDGMYIQMESKKEKDSFFHPRGAGRAVVGGYGLSIAGPKLHHRVG
jgi:hypothetical protein